MRVLHVITRLVAGGAQRNTLLTAVSHRRLGVDAELLHGSDHVGREGDLLAEAGAAGVPLHHLPVLQREPGTAADLRALAALTSFLRRHRFDLVHTHTSKAGILGRLAARLAAVRAVVHTPHGHVFHGYYGPLTTGLYVQLERVAAVWADRLIALTPSERADHLARGIGEADRFVVVPSGIDVAHFAAASGSREGERAGLGAGAGDLLIGCVGRLAPIKGQAVLVRALARLRRAGLPARVVLVGDGEERGRLAALARSLGVSERLRFTGRLEDPAAVMAAFDVAAVPSLNEGMGRVVVEAMAARIPLVASATGGIPDLVEHERTGLLAPPGDDVALAASLARLAGDPALALALAARGRERAQGYSVEAMAGRLLGLYRQLLDA